MILLDLPGGRTKDPRKVRTKHVLDVMLRCCTQFHASRLQKHVLRYLKLERSIPTSRQGFLMVSEIQLSRIPLMVSGISLRGSGIPLTLRVFLLTVYDTHRIVSNWNSTALMWNFTDPKWNFND
jgi:hypothetical protein